MSADTFATFVRARRPDRRTVRLGSLLAVAGLVLALPALSACSDVRSALGYEKNAPDEFQVVARPPLSLPPNYGLRPPEPGAARPQERSVADGAERTVFGRGGVQQIGGAVYGERTNIPSASPSASVTSQSTGEARLSEKLGVAEANPDIRQVVNQETADYVYEQQYVIDRLLFWREKPEAGIVVDAEKEQRRLQENAALGKAVTDGETPSITRKRVGLFF